MKDADSEPIIDIVEMSEGNFCRIIFDSATPELAKTYGISWQEVGGATALFLDAMPSSILFNRVIGLGVREPVSEALLDEVLTLYKNRNTVICVPVNPRAKAASLPEWLLKRGFKHSFNLAKMIRGTEPVAEIKTDFQIMHVDESTAVQAGKIIQSVFEMPEWVASWFANWLLHSDVMGYVALDREVPVAAGGLVRTGEEWGGLVNGATLPAYRRRGAQSAILAARIRDGIGQGCRWLTTETGEDTKEHPNSSYHNMIRTGFQLAYLQPWYVYEPEM